MVHIYTFCDKILFGRKNLSANLLCEEMYKLNLEIEDVCVKPEKYDISNIEFKNKEIYFLLSNSSIGEINKYLANLMGDELLENKTLKDHINNVINRNGITTTNVANFYNIPSKCKYFFNMAGAIQGYLTKIGECEIFVLPNDINSIKSIIYNGLGTYLEEKYKNNFKVETYRIFGLSQEKIMEMLNDFTYNSDNVLINIFGDGLDNMVFIKAEADNPKYEDYRRNIYAKLQKYVYSVVDLSMLDQLKKMAYNQGVNLAIAGDISASKLIYDLTGISGNIKESLIFPNIKSVNNYLKISKGFIDAQDVFDIAVKQLERAHSDIAVVSFCELNEVSRGVCFIAVGNKVKIDVYKHRFTGSDDEIINNVASLGVFYLLKRLQLKDVKTI